MEKDSVIPTCFDTAQAAKLSGLPRTTLDYLRRTELVLPSLSMGQSKRGCARRYSFGDVVLLKAIAHLLNLGVSVSRLKQALKRLFETHHEITPGTIPGRYLVTDGRNVYFRTDKHSLESLNENGQLTFSFIIEIENYRNQVVEEVRKSSFQRLG
jgi:DNA-binding transcriptional MerR regulator